MLSVLGVGTGLPEKLTLEGFSLLKNAKNIILQSDQVPLATFLHKENIAFTTLDAFYETAADFETFVDAVTKHILKQGDALLCLLGDLFTNTLLQHLVRECSVQLYFGVSFFSNALSASMEGIAAGPTFMCSAANFLSAKFYGDETIVLTEVDSPYIAAEISTYLQRFYDAQTTVYITKQDTVTEQSLGALQYYEGFSYDTCVVLAKPLFLQKQTYSFVDFCNVIEKLRAPEGCPWDREQTHKSLRASLIEECYEAVEAIDLADPYMLADELGDVLLQVVLHAQIASEHGEFDIIDICDIVTKKMVRRHPHVFGQAQVSSSQDVLKNWDEIKREEKKQKTKAEILRDIPAATGPLMRAQKLQKKAVGFGFDWPDYFGPLEKVNEELAELLVEVKKEGRIEEEAGDLLFAAVNLLRKLGIDAETALLTACKKFTDRITIMEKMAVKDGKLLEEMDIQSQEALWEAAKCEKTI